MAKEVGEILFAKEEDERRHEMFDMDKETKEKLNVPMERKQTANEASERRRSLVY